MVPAATHDTLNILLVEDVIEEGALREVEASVRARGTNLVTSQVTTRDALRRALTEASWDVVLSDYKGAELSAIEVLRVIKQAGQDVSLIVVSGFVGDEPAVWPVKREGADFVSNSDLAGLREAVDRSVRELPGRRRHAAAVRALANSEARYKNLISNLPSLVFQWVFTPRGPGKWLYLSKRPESLLGVAQEELEANPGLFVDLIAQEDRYGFQTACKNVMAGGVLRWGGRLLRPGRREPVWIELRAQVRPGNSGDYLADGIIDDVSVRKRFELELLASRTQLRQLSEHLEDAKEQERATIAREVHDELGGLLTAAKIELAALTRQLPASDSERPSAALSCETLIDQAMDISRRIARRLRPAILDHGIVAAIEWLARDFSLRMGISCDVAVESEHIEIAPQRATVVFRVLQEALTNIARHARARHVNVELETRSKGQIVLRVLDDGVGIALEDIRKPQSYGIRGMCERAESLGGALRVAPARGGGTEVWLVIPLARANETDRSSNPATRSS